MKYYYDFHLHSCLSPCGDADMTPNNIVNMAKLSGLDAIAVTDHNACGNCAAAMAVGERVGLLVLPGMELNTVEEVHVVCLFEQLAGALQFEQLVKNNLPYIENRVDIFGEQLILNENDEVVGSEPSLLTVATNISVMDIARIAREFGGAAFPAHIDKESYSVISALGFLTPEMNFPTVEISRHGNYERLLATQPCLKDAIILHNSDAHYLQDISQQEHFLDLTTLTRKNLINYILQKH